MKYLISTVVVGFALVSFGVFYYISQYQGPLIKVMNPTYFESEQRLGEVLAERFFVDIKDKENGLFVLGDSGDVNSDQSMWSFFILKLKELGLEVESFQQVEDQKELAELNIDRNSGRHFVVLPSTLENRSSFDKNVISFWPTDYIHLKTDSDKPTLECDFKDPKVSFDCLSQRVRFQYYRRRLKENKYSAMVQQLYDNAYIVYIYEPEI